MHYLFFVYIFFELFFPSQSSAKKLKDDYQNANKILLDQLNLGDKEPKLNISEEPKNTYRNKIPWQKYAYRPMEQLHFDVYHETAFSKIYIGKASMSTGEVKFIEGRWALEFKFEAISADWYSWVFVIKNSAKGYFDIDTTETLYLNLSKHENTYKIAETIEFNKEHNLIFEKTVKDNKTTFKQYQLLKKNVLDGYSIVYLFRQNLLLKKQDITCNVYQGGNLYRGKGINKGNINKTIKGKTRKTREVAITTKLSGAMEQKGGLSVFLSDDVRHIPLLIEADVKIGRFTLELNKKSNW